MPDAPRQKKSGNVKEVRIQPHNIEAEQALLGTILINNEIGDLVFPKLGMEMFYDPVHAFLYETLKQQIQRGRTVDNALLRHAIASHEGLQELGGADYLVRISGAVVSTISAPDYAATIRDLYVRRSAVAMAEQIQTDAATFSEPEDTADQIIDRAEGKLALLRTVTSAQTSIHRLGEGLDLAMTRTSEAFHRGGTPDTPTGMKSVDDIVNGWQPSHLIVIGARTSVGKTAFAASTSVSVARAGKGVFFAGFEMDHGELAHRLLSCEAHYRGLRVPYQSMTTGSIDEETFKQLLEIGRDIADWPLITAGVEVSHFGRLRGALRQARRRFERAKVPMGLVVVDYVQLGRVEGARDKAQEVAYFARELKNMAAEFECPVLTTSQVKREVDDRRVRRPMLSDLRWAGEIEEAANSVGLLYRPAYYDQLDAKSETDPEKRSALIAAAEAGKNKLEIGFEKNRGGRTGTADVWIDVATNFCGDGDPAERLQQSFEGEF